jgi:FMNH2-dependent dimethyl sulfone monooxygenase
MALTKRNNPGADRHFKLGLFAANCSGGQAATTVPESWSGNWDENRQVAIIADNAGIDFLLPIARWRGYDGASIFHMSSLETTTWAAALLAVTQRLTVVSTVHVAFTHPVMAAKQFATLAQIGQGRFALNVVCGWNEPEYRMFGLNLPQDHKDRYAYGREWLDIVRKLWRSDRPFDWHGAHFHLEQTVSAPRPDIEPIILNAAASTEGRQFAIEQSDLLFTSLTDLEKARRDVAALKAQASNEHGRMIDVLGVGHVVCRQTRREALEYYDHYANVHGDWVAVDRLMDVQSRFAKSFSADELQKFRVRFAAGHGTYPLVGSPDDIAAEIARIEATGLAGIAVSFVNYLDELPYFCAEVLPRLANRSNRSN